MAGRALSVDVLARGRRLHLGEEISLRDAGDPGAVGLA
jgi:hypothetical protein